MVKDHSDSERGNLLLPLHRLLFPIISNDSVICLCYTSRGALAGMRNRMPWPEVFMCGYSWLQHS